jgi:hypothetical protein
MNGNTPLLGSIPVDRPTIMVIVALPLKRAVIFSRSAALRTVVSRQQSQPFVPAENEEGPSPMIFIASLPFLLEAPFLVLLTPVFG